MPDKWLTAQLNLTALTPFKAFATLTTAFAIAFLSSTAIAETTEERQACFSDAFRVCWLAIPDRNAVFHCLMGNRPRLNPACRTVMDQYRREHRIRRASRDARAGLTAFTFGLSRGSISRASCARFAVNFSVRHGTCHEFQVETTFRALVTEYDCDMAIVHTDSDLVPLRQFLKTLEAVARLPSAASIQHP